MASKQTNDRTSDHTTVIQMCHFKTQDDHVDNVSVTRHASRHMHFLKRDGHEIVGSWLASKICGKLILRLCLCHPR